MNLSKESFMNSLVDVHCHILYGLDDGAKTIKQSFELVLDAYKKGITSIIFTPHYRRGHFKFDIQKVDNHFAHIVKLCADYLPDVKLYKGCEIFYNSDVPKKLSRGELYTLAGSKYVLMEFSPTVQFDYISTSVRDIVNYGYWPIIAHAERYACMRKNLENADTLIDEGGFIQINADSILGKCGYGYKSYCKKLLKNGLVHFVGTDCHDIKKRGIRLNEAASYVANKFGTEYAEELFCDNPRHIVEKKLLGGY